MLSNPLSEDPDCRCEPAFEADRLVVDADGCPGGGDLVSEAACRATVVSALERRDVEAVCTRSAGLERAYEDDAAALLVAAGRFADAVSFHDGDLAARARSDPLAAVRDATGRGNPFARIAAETGLAEFVPAEYETALRPEIGPTIAHTRISAGPPPGATLSDTYELESGAVVRLYTGTDPPTYHLMPAEHRLDASATEALAAAYERLARGAVEGGERAPARAVRVVADSDDPVETLVSVLRKHTRGLGIFEDCFADPDVTDAFATSPVTDNRIRLRRDGETYRTNVRLTERGAAGLASRFRRESGRAFSRASPTLDTTVDVGGRRVRIAGVTSPVTEGLSFALRGHDETAFRLSDLVDNGTIPPDAAGVLSVATERGAAMLLAGPRSAGKTTTLGALLWELPPSIRTVAIEDTPELPISQLQSAGYDVQPLLVETGDGASIPPEKALRTALRLGDGAIVVGEVRGEEARVLYEAMRVGAADGAVIGTIHGEGAETVRERVVTDLGVPETAFADTDLVVTLAAYETDDGRERRLQRIETVRRTDDGVGFVTIHDGESRSEEAETVYSDLSDPSETAGDVRRQVERRTDRFAGDFGRLE